MLQELPTFENFPLAALKRENRYQAGGSFGGRQRTENVLENRALCIKRETEKHPPTTWALANIEQQGGYLGKSI